MSPHYIFTSSPKKASLCQGDVLAVDGSLRDEINALTPAPIDEVQYLLVLTQTCDLERRESDAPKAERIVVCVVYPVEDVIRSEAKKYQKLWHQCANLISARARDALKLFVERMMDQNEPGHFYLHEDITLRISTKCCAVLSHVISLPIDLYETCCEAKTAELKQEFQAKLGWLAGTSYSRVGTVEWDEPYGRNNKGQEAARLIQATVRPVESVQLEEVERRLTDTGYDLTTVTADEVGSVLKDTKLIRRDVRIRERIAEIVRKFDLIKPARSSWIHALKNSTELVDKIAGVMETREKGEERMAAAKIIAIVTDELSRIVDTPSEPTKTERRLDVRLQQDTILVNLLRSADEYVARPAAP